MPIEIDNYKMRKKQKQKQKQKQKKQKQYDSKRWDALFFPFYKLEAEPKEKK